MDTSRRYIIAIVLKLNLGDDMARFLKRQKGTRNLLVLEAYSTYME